jgi:N-acetylmuramoyl-L-alanine amidase
VTYFDRAAWGAHNADTPGGVLDDIQTRTHFVVHHTTGSALGNPDPAQWVRNIQNEHMYVNGWADIGYNFLVAQNGDYYEGRGWERSGACQYNLNTAGLCVAYLGGGSSGSDADYDPLPPTQAALRTIRALADEANYRAGRELIRLGHQEVPGNATACPGDLLLAWVHAGMPVGPVEAMPPEHLVIAMLSDGKVLGANGDQTANGTHVNQWGLTGRTSQWWAPENLGNGQLLIWNVASEKVLSVDLNAKAGSHVILWERVNEDPSQLWTFEARPNGMPGYVLRHLATGLSVGIAGGSSEGAVDALLVEDKDLQAVIGIWVVA